jgi:1,4-dihydroxy-2-naphthoyl-CoA hydrolase
MTTDITFDQYIGMEFVEVGPEEEGQCVRARIVVQPHHQNPTGYVNGGVILSLADNLATGMAGRAHFAKTGERSFWLGVDVHAAMLSNQKGGELLAESRVVRAGRRVSVIRTVVTGDQGKAIAEVTTTHVPA